MLAKELTLSDSDSTSSLDTFATGRSFKLEDFFFEFNPN